MTKLNKEYCKLGELPVGTTVEFNGQQYKVTGLEVGIGMVALESVTPSIDLSMSSGIGDLGELSLSRDLEVQIIQEADK